jgi:hypothetical protein
MERDVVEVVARFGGTIIDVAHVGPTETYRIGSAPTANLAVPGLTCFPLVDGRMIRHPHGIAAVEHEGWSELQIGALTLWVGRTKLAVTPVARRRPEWRVWAFLAASLIAHLAVWLIAVTTAPLERLVDKPRPMILVHNAVAPERVEPKPARKRESAAAAQPANGDRVPRPRAKRRTSATEEMGHDAGYWAARVMKSIDDAHVVEQVGALTAENQYDEDAENAKGFGGSPRMGPPESIKTNGYEGIMIPFNVKLCPNKSCTVKGPIPALFIRTHLHAHMDAIYDCYLEHAGGPGTIVLEFSITADGAVRDAHGSGLGETGACAAGVLGEIYFKALGNDYDPPRETHVRYPVLFKAEP